MDGNLLKSEMLFVNFLSCDDESCLADQSRQVPIQDCLTLAVSGIFSALPLAFRSLEKFGAGMELSAL